MGARHKTNGNRRLWVAVEVAKSRQKRRVLPSPVHRCGLSKSGELTRACLPRAPTQVSPLLARSRSHGAPRSVVPHSWWSVSGGLSWNDSETGGKLRQRNANVGKCAGYCLKSSFREEQSHLMTSNFRGVFGAVYWRKLNLMFPVKLHVPWDRVIICHRHCILNSTGFFVLCIQYCFCWTVFESLQHMGWSCASIQWVLDCCDVSN